MLGRDDALFALGVESEPDPDTLTDEQRERLAELAESRLEGVATELVEEAAASDDVSDGMSALVFIRDRLRTFAGLLTDDQLQRLEALAVDGVAAWG